MILIKHYTAHENEILNSRIVYWKLKKSINNWWRNYDYQNRSRLLVEYLIELIHRINFQGNHIHHIVANKVEIFSSAVLSIEMVDYLWWCLSSHLILLQHFRNRKQWTNSIISFHNMMYKIGLVLDRSHSWSCTNKQWTFFKLTTLSDFVLCNMIVVQIL